MVTQLQGITQQPLTADELQRAQAYAQHIKTQVFSDSTALAKTLSDSLANLRRSHFKECLVGHSAGRWVSFLHNQAVDNLFLRLC